MYSNLTTLPGFKQNIFLISFAKELYYTVAATLLYVLAWIALLAGYGWCAGTGICDARIAAGVSNLGLQFEGFIITILSMYSNVISYIL